MNEREADLHLLAKRLSLALVRVHSLHVPASKDSVAFSSAEGRPGFYLTCMLGCLALTLPVMPVALGYRLKS